MPKELPRITIITPSFNQGKFIEETIASVLNQNYPNLEYWVIDGGSTDQTISVLKKYDQRINWISEPDHGQTDAINKGLKKATGEIIAYLNSDDAYMPGALQSIAEIFLQKPDVQWVTGDYTIVDANGRRIQHFVPWYKKLFRYIPSFYTLAVVNYIAQPSTFWRRSLHIKVGQFDDALRYCMDYDFWLRCIKESKPYVLQKSLSFFRIHQSSKGGSAYTKQFAEEEKVLTRYTTNKLVQLLHTAHNRLIVAIYMVIK